jgi:hypothetical protein
MEKVVENLGFIMEIHKKQVPLRGQKFKDMALEKNFAPLGASDWP